MSDPTSPATLKFGNIELAINPSNDEHAQAFVPTWDDHHEFDADLLESLAVGLALDMPVLVVGPTGCGKTSTVRNLAAAVNQPVRRINLHGDVRSADLVGEKALEVDAESGESVTEWRDGVLPDAWRNGYWLLLDEFDAMPPHVAFILQAALEGGDLVLADNHGEVIPRHPNTRIIATANTIGRGDESGLYTGTNVLNEATLDRFSVVEVDYVGKAQEEAILVARTGLAKAEAKKLVEAASEIRSALKRGDCYATLSTRRLVAWGLFAKALGSVEKAYGMAVRNKLAGEDREFFDGVMQRVIGFTPKQ